MLGYRSSLVSACVAATLICVSPAYAQDRIALDPDGKNGGTLDYGLVIGGIQPRIGVTGVDCIPPNAPPRCRPVIGVTSGTSTTGISSRRTAGPNQYGLDLWTYGAPRLSITTAGSIGIGILQPTRTVEIHHPGDVELGLQSADQGGRLWTIQSSGQVAPTLVGTFQVVDRTQNISRLTIDSTGLVSVKALQITGGADLAEPFRTTSLLPSGAVVSIDELASGQLKESGHAYDRRVAGIVSGANGINPGVTLNQLDLGGGSQQIALSGRVYVLADATHASIEPGDMLTTSNIPGRAMKATNLRKAQGAIIGKAMSTLKSGTGSVLVLVSLQ